MDYSGQAMQKDATYRQGLSANACDTPSVQRQSEATFQDIVQRANRLNELAIRLEQLTNRLCGPQPPSTQAGVGKPTPQPDSLAAKLSIMVIGLEQLTDHIASSVNRLEAFA